MAEEQLRRAQQLLQEKRYDEARVILGSLDHDVARQWLARLDQLEAAQGAASGTPPGQLQGIVEQVQALIREGRYDEAAALLQGVDHPSAQALLAQVNRFATQASPETPSAPRANVTRTGPDSYSREVGTYEMLWDCQYCGATKLLGKTHRHCPNCGAAQNPDSRYFPSDEEKVAVEDHIYHGADVTCPACDTLNSAAAQFCGNCGAPLEGGERAKMLGEQVRGAGETFESGGSRDVAQERFDSEMERIGVKPKAREADPRQKWIIGGVIVAVVLAIIAGAYALFSTREASLLVAGHSWERQIEIEAYRTFNEGTWCDSLPPGANVISRSQRQRSTNRIPDGETCTTRRVDNGDGTFREVEDCRTTYREEPVYDDYCTYTINRWDHDRWVTASGDNVNDTPYWPEYSLVCTGQVIGCEREGQRQESYLAHFREVDSDATFDCGFDQPTWAGYGIETRWTMDVGRVITQPRCETLRPAN